VSKDTDFRERSFVEGFPPRIIWLDVGNAGTRSIADLLRRERHRSKHSMGKRKFPCSFCRSARTLSDRRRAVVVLRDLCASEVITFGKSVG